MMMMVEEGMRMCSYADVMTDIIDGLCSATIYTGQDYHEIA